MPLKLKCPSCSHILTVPTQRAGSTLRCAVCNKKLRVPHLPEAPPREAKSPGEPRQRARAEEPASTHPPTDIKPTAKTEASSPTPKSQDSQPTKRSKDDKAARRKKRKARRRATATPAGSDKETEPSDGVAKKERSLPRDDESKTGTSPNSVEPKSAEKESRPEPAEEEARETGTPPAPVAKQPAEDKPLESEGESSRPAARERSKPEEGPIAESNSQNRVRRTSKSVVERKSTDSEVRRTPETVSSPDFGTRSEQHESDSAGEEAGPSSAPPDPKPRAATPPPRPRAAAETKSADPHRPKPPPLSKSQQRTAPPSKIRIEPSEVVSTSTEREVGKRQPPPPPQSPSTSPPKRPPKPEKPKQQARPAASRPVSAESERADDVAAAPAAPETAEPEPATRGYEHDLGKRWPVYYLGLSMIAAALFGTIPAVMELVDHFQALDSPGISPWAIGLMLLCGIQLAYAVYILQIPDWATVWVASVVTLITAALYAMLLGFAVLAKSDSQVIQMLGLTDKLYGNQATGWCFIMLSISILLSYFGGRISVRWYQAYCLITGLDAEPEVVS